MNQEYNIVDTAKTWDSFKNTLYKCLDIFKPSSILEYGPGVSTSIMAMYPSVNLVDSIEHDVAWYNRALVNIHKNVKVYLEPNLEMYPHVEGRQNIYDMVFVDGREREKCLKVAKTRIRSGGVIILHDAKRPEYKNSLQMFDYRFIEDDGHTAILTDSIDALMKLEDL